MSSQTEDPDRPTLSVDEVGYGYERVNLGIEATAFYSAATDLDSDGTIDVALWSWSDAQDTSVTQVVMDAGGENPRVHEFPYAIGNRTGRPRQAGSPVLSFSPIALLSWQDGEIRHEPVADGDDWLDATLIDANGDGEDEIVASGPRIELFERERSGFARTSLADLAGDSCEDVAVGNVDDDRFDDLLAVCGRGSNTYVLIWYGGRRGLRGEPTRVEAPSTRSVEVFDLNDDGVSDLILASESFYWVNVAYGAGSGVFDEPVLFHEPDEYYAGLSRLQVADFWAEGSPLLAIGDYSGTTFYEPYSLGIRTRRIWDRLAHAVPVAGDRPHIVGHTPLFPSGQGAERRFVVLEPVPAARIEDRVAVSQFSVGATSELPDARIQGRYAAGKATDNDPRSSWVENDSGDGIGEQLRLEFDRAVVASAIEVMPGYFDEQWWAANNRVRDATIVVTNEFGVDSTYTATFEDSMTPQLIEITRQPLTRVQLRIDSVYRGERWRDTCIAELRIVDEDRHVPVRTGRHADQPPSGTMVIADESRSGSELWFFYRDGSFRHVIVNRSSVQLEREARGTWTFDAGTIVLREQMIKRVFGVGEPTLDPYAPPEMAFPVYESFETEYQWVDRTVEDSWDRPRVIVGNRTELP